MGPATVLDRINTNYNRDTDVILVVPATVSERLRQFDRRAARACQRTASTRD